MGKYILLRGHTLLRRQIKKGSQNLSDALSIFPFFSLCVIELLKNRICFIISYSPLERAVVCGLSVKKFPQENRVCHIIIRRRKRKEKNQLELGVSREKEEAIYQLYYAHLYTQK